MKKILFFLLLSTSFNFTQSAEEEKIKSTINQLFNRMKNGDSIAIKNVFSGKAIMQTINSKSEIHSESFVDFARSIGKFKKGDLEK